MKNLAFFISGDGIFVKYLYENKEKLTDAKISLIVTDEKKQAYDFFNNLAPTYHADYSHGRDAAEEKLLSILEDHKIDLVFLTYDQIIGKTLLEKYKHKIFNLHLSILPLHPYLHALEKSIESKDLFLGATFHEVTRRVDRGRILGQVIMAKDTSKSYFELRLEVLQLAQVFFLDMIYKVTSKSRLSEKGRIHLLDEKVPAVIFNPPLSKEIKDL